MFDQISKIALVTRQELEKACTENLQNFYLGDHMQLCRILTKYKIYIDTRDIGIAPNLLMDGYWESWITKFIAGKVKKGDVCIDAGANFGYYSLLLAELAGKEGRTIAIEPNEYLCKLLFFSSKLNEYHFDVVGKALSDRSGEVTLSIPAHFWGGGTIRAEKVDDEVITQTVQMLTLDELCTEKEITKVDFIKMDCEGVEPQIFTGMQKLMAQNPQLKMVMEYSPFMYKEPQAFTEFLLSRFNIGEITGDSVVVPFTKQDSGHLLNLDDHIDMFLELKQQ